MRSSLLLILQLGVSLVYGIQYNVLERAPALSPRIITPLPAGEACLVATDCISKSCLNSFCATAPLHGKCYLDQDCLQGTCQSGECLFLGEGSFCDDSTKCASNQCVSGQCYALGGGSGQFCTDPLECASSGCVIDTLGENYVCDISYLGAACTSNWDCAIGSCSDNRCRVANGMACSLRDQCISGTCSSGYCGLTYQEVCFVDSDCRGGSCINGKCGRLPDGVACVNSDGSECLSGQCLEDKAKCPVSSLFSRISMCCIPQDQGSVTGTTSKPASLTSTTSTTTTKKGGPTSTKPTSTPKPSTCTKNVQCRSGYCRKRLLADGVKRSSVGLCEVKKPSRSRCYQNGGCISGKCRKNVGVCV
ncbi:hypothetical protein CF326_g3991 [Tilletia indica]|nr:hypothetical protein CF326_g3991 [Tilletia indica]